MQLGARVAGEREGQRGGGVVALADVQDAQARERAEPGAHGGEVGERLGGMLLGAHRVDDRHPPLRGQRRHLGDGSGRPDDEDVQHAAEHAAGVLDRLAGVQLQVPGAVGDEAAPSRRAALENAVRVRVEVRVK
nr:hypothetical protein GCM10020093_033850 [Planobispora longispora]